MSNNHHHKKVIVGMSGGVDSSVAALLLTQQGYQVEGLFMKNWEADDDDDYCTAEQDLADARAVCTHLQIPLHTVNFAQTYWDKVFRYFLEEYRRGRTPNPDVLCNKEIKFRAFLDYAISQGADHIATGHYARTAVQHNKVSLYQGLDPDKDQSYFLYLLNQQQLQASLFPIGNWHKTDVRHIAEKQGFINYNKKDSTGICFIGERRFKTFLQEYLPAQPGNIETEDGHIIGHHDGLMYYTIGQRQGLHIGGIAGTPEAPWYVADKELARNVLIVVQGSKHPRLYAPELLCSQIHWISGETPALPLSCQAKTRYRQPSQACTVYTTGIDGQLLVQFTQPQRAITPGQSVVFYQQEECLGGGIIQCANLSTSQ